MKNLAILFAIAFVFHGTHKTSAGPWNAYLAGNDRIGNTNDSISPNLQLQWTYQAPARPVKAWPGPYLSVLAFRWISEAFSANSQS